MAEEGTVYLQKAWYAPPWAALLAIDQGYYSLTMNVLGLLTARVFPLEWAAVTFTTVSLLAWMTTVFLAIHCESFTSTRTRALAAGVCLLTPAIEVWLTAEDIQFVLVLATALICISSETRLRGLRTCILAVAGLTGPVSCVLAPFFLYRAFVRKTAMAWIQAGVLTSCALFMASVVVRSLLAGSRHIDRSGKLAWFGPILFAKIFAVDFTTRLGAFVVQRLCLSHHTLAVCTLFWLLTLVSLTLFWKLAHLAGPAGKMAFFMALATLGFNYIGIEEPVNIVLIGAFRYFFTGSALFLLVLVLAYDRASSQASPRLARRILLLVSLSFLCCLMDAVGYWKRFQYRVPVWRDEVAMWRADPAYRLHVSPPSWEETLSLDPAHRRPHSDR